MDEAGYESDKIQNKIYNELEREGIIVEIKRIIWEFHEEGGRVSVNEMSTGCDEEKKTSFRLHRYKNKRNYEEHMEIECLYEGKGNGSIETAIYRLDDDLMEVMKYGVVFSGHVFLDLKQEIIENYSKLEIEYVEGRGSVDFILSVEEHGVLLEGIIDYLEKNNIECRSGFYNIRVADFNKLMVEIDVDDRSAKNWLKEKGYVETAPDRTSRNIRIDGEVERVISIREEVVVSE